MSVSAKSARFRQVHGSALITWRCKDLQHLLLFAEDFEILGLTGGNTFLLNKFQDGVPLKLKNNTLWRAGYAPADRQTSWGVLHPY
jgi:hypothetical protein